MAYTVPYSFDLFYESINLSGDHREIANKRKDHVVGLLKNDFEILESFPTGSIHKYTALRGRADLDVMVALHYSKHIKDKSPKQVLQDVRDVLGEYRTGARKNGQAVTLYYKTWPNVDIVPVSRSINDAGEVTHYNVPNENTGVWIPSRPKSHALSIEERAGACGGNFRKVIKMMKWWSAVHGDYLSGYHIEVLALNILYGELEGLPWNIYWFFKSARPLLEKKIWNQLSYADDYLSENDRNEVLRRIDMATEKAFNAWYATSGSNDNHEKAIGLWRQIFGDKFPAYGG